MTTAESHTIPLSPGSGGDQTPRSRLSSVENAALALFAPMELLPQASPVPGEAPTDVEEEQLPAHTAHTLPPAQRPDAGSRGSGPEALATPTGPLAGTAAPTNYDNRVGGPEASNGDGLVEQPVPDGVPVAPASPPVKWYRSRWCRVLAIRIAMRLSMIGFVVGMGFVFSFRGAVDKYAHWMRGRHPEFAGIVLFTVASSLFASVAPGSYGPIVLGGATFGIWIGWGMGYVAMNVGSMLNLVFIRYLLRGCASARCQVRLDRLNVKVIEALLAESPKRTVFLLRLPMLTGGILNYMFSLSRTLGTRDMAIANALGFLPGCLLFSAFGQSGTSIIRSLLDGETSSAEFIQSIVIIVVGLLVVVVTVMMVRRTIKRLRSEQAEEAARGKGGYAPGAEGGAGAGAGASAVGGSATGMPKYGVSSPGGGQPEGVQLAGGRDESAAPAASAMVV